MVTPRVRKLEYNTRLTGAAGTSEGWNTFQRDPGEEMGPCKPHGFNEPKGKVLHLGWNNSEHRLGSGKSPAEEDLEYWWMRGWR